MANSIQSLEVYQDLWCSSSSRSSEEQGKIDLELPVLWLRRQRVSRYGEVGKWSQSVFCE